MPKQPDFGYSGAEFPRTYGRIPKPLSTGVENDYPPEKFWLRRQRTSVRTDSPGSGKQKGIPPLSPREFCPILFQKALEIIAYQNLSTDQMFGGFQGPTI